MILFEIQNPIDFKNLSGLIFEVTKYSKTNTSLIFSPEYPKPWYFP